MVKGLDVFTQWFKPYPDQYVLIGGTAAAITMEAVGQTFRATKDLDIVLHIEVLTPSVGKTFWEFIKAGEYQIQQTNDGTPKLYRFQKPKNEAFPWMLELFSRTPEGMRLGKDSHLTPIPLDESMSSLSAILLDEDYYQFVLSGRKMRNGFASWIAEDRLIPLKILAWLDLTTRKNAGEEVDSKKIRKHLNDIVNLSGLLTPQSVIKIAPKISIDLKHFLSKVRIDDIQNYAVIKERLTLAYNLAKV
jgi:hypothetical protein